MNRSVAAFVFACILPLAVSCDGPSAISTGPGVQFIAANSSTVIIDTTRGADAELDQARAMATQKCGLFGGSSAVLESLNVVSNNRERASFLCK
jgi:hypothetical protein